MTKTESKRGILVLRYHPKLKSVSDIIKKHCTTMVKDPILQKIFPERPMLAFRQPPNLRSQLVRAKHPTKVNPPRTLVGMHKCNKPCKILFFSLTAIKLPTKGITKK